MKSEGLNKCPRLCQFCGGASIAHSTWSFDDKKCPDSNSFLGELDDWSVGVIAFSDLLTYPFQNVIWHYAVSCIVLRIDIELCKMHFLFSRSLELSSEDRNGNRYMIMHQIRSKLRLERVMAVKELHISKCNWACQTYSNPSLRLTKTIYALNLLRMSLFLHFFGGNAVVMQLYLSITEFFTATWVSK